MARTPASRGTGSRVREPGTRSLAQRLHRRRGEIEQAIMARVYGVADPTATGDPAYVSGLRTAVAAAVTYSLAALEHPREPTPAPPAALIAQARHAARNGVGLDTVLRRYFAGYMLLGDFLIQAAREGDPAERSEELQQVWRALAALFDRLLTEVAERHGEEAGGQGRDAEQRRGERVRRLLAGELVEVEDLGYELDALHLGAIAAGPGARSALRDLAAELDRQVLMVDGGGGTVWAWMGGRRPIAVADALRLAEAKFSPAVALALGELEENLAGWRLTHRQARAAAPIALRGAPSLVRYADVALLASALGDEVLANSLRETYMVPLEEGRDGGAALRKTLCAYFAAGRNVSAAAASLGASRRTVANRLAQVEERIGRPIDSCAAEIETALRLWQQEAGSGANLEMD